MSQELIFQLALSFLKISKLSIQPYRESYPKLSLVYNLHDE